MAIHKVDRVFVISSYDTWRPGCYENERTAKYAFKFCDQDLSDLQNSVNPGGIITFKMLQDKAKSNKLLNPITKDVAG